MRFILVALIALLMGCSAAPVKTSVPKADGLGFTYTHNEPSKESFVPVENPVWISAAFTQDEKDILKAAMTEWNMSLNGYYEFTLMSENYMPRDEGPAEKYIADTYIGLLITRISPADADEAVGEGVLAWVDGLRGHGMHVVADRMGTRRMKTVMLHEFGHVVGIGHVLIKGALMAPGYPYNAPCIDKVTVLQVGAMRPEWNWRNLNWCNWPQ